MANNNDNEIVLKEKCSYNKGHSCPDKSDYYDDLYNWWLEYACRGKYKDIGAVVCAIGRLRDYIEGYDEEYQPHGFPKDLNDNARLDIVYHMLEKMADTLRRLQ